MPKKKRGYIFQDEIQESANEQNIWFFRVKDVNIPPDLRNRVKVSENPYDSLVFKKGWLFPTELKSTKGKSLPFKNIKPHQIKNLIQCTTYNEPMIPGFLINFSECGKTFFLHINKFVEYQKLAMQGKNEIDGVKVNKKSISIEYCEVYGTELKGVLKKTKYRWYVGDLLDELIKKYS